MTDNKAELKAKDMVEKFMPLVNYRKSEETENSINVSMGNSVIIEHAKQCAIIAVDEILNISYFTHEPTEEDELYKNYWQEVKQSINQL